jgi:hypothetical protein
MKYLPVRPSSKSTGRSLSESKSQQESFSFLGKNFGPSGFGYGFEHGSGLTEQIKLEPMQIRDIVLTLVNH